MLVMAQRKSELQSNLLCITKLLESLGFVINQDKSHLKPSQTILYLGFMIDSREMKIRTEDGKNCGNMQGCTTEAVLVTTGAGQSDRQDDCLPTGHLPGSLMVQRTTAPQESNLATISVIRSTGDVESGGSVGTRMVVQQNAPGE